MRLLLLSGYIAQAADLLQMYAASPDPASQYPLDELGWLLALSNNEAEAAWASANVEGAKSWFETSLRLVRFLPGAERKLEKVSEHIAHSSMIELTLTVLGGGSS